MSRMTYLRDRMSIPLSVIFHEIRNLSWIEMVYVCIVAIMAMEFVEHFSELNIAYVEYSG